MKRTLQLLGLLLILWAAIFCMQQDVLGQGQHYPRFHRYALTRLDDTTSLDMVKDTTKPGVCRLVYRVQMSTEFITYGGYKNTNASVAVTYLGEVPCDPAPVPMPVPVVMSPVR